jgi:hypothetical protein
VPLDGGASPHQIFEDSLGGAVLHDEAKTKGVGFMNVRAFATERFGAGGWDATLEAVTPADRDVLASVLPVGWYPLSLYARLVRALDETHGTGDLTLVVQLGRFEAERDLTTIHRVFLRAANPAYAVEKFGEYWRRFHDSGRWLLTRHAATHLSGVLSDWGVVDYALCRELVGYIGRVLELVGARNVRMEHPRCRGRADAECFFDARWGVAAGASPQSSLAVPDARAFDTRSLRPLATTAREETVSGSRQAFAASIEKLRPDSRRKAGG